MVNFKFKFNQDIYLCLRRERVSLNTLSMLARLRRIIEACAIRVKTVRRARWEYRSCGRKSSSRKVLLNIVPTISFITTEREWQVRKKKDWGKSEILNRKKKSFPKKKKTERSCWNLHNFFKSFTQKVIIFCLIMNDRDYMNCGSYF